MSAEFFCKKLSKNTSAIHMGAVIALGITTPHGGNNGKNISIRR